MPKAKAKRQQPDELSASSWEVRFEGFPILDAGVVPVPRMFLLHYAHLGLSEGQLVFILHLVAYKWKEDAPWPSYGAMPMAVSDQTKRDYVRDLRKRGLIFTSRLFWTEADLEAHPNAQPGKCRANVWWLGSFMHNISRVDAWLKAGNPLPEFRVEIPESTMAIYSEGIAANTGDNASPAPRLSDIPQPVNAIMVWGLALSGRPCSILLPSHLPSHLSPEAITGQLCQKGIVVNQLCQKQVVEKGIVNKNHESNKNQLGEGEIDSFGEEKSEDEAVTYEEFAAGLKAPPMTGVRRGGDGHQRHVDEASALPTGPDPIEDIAKHLWWGTMGEGVPLPAKKQWSAWRDAAGKLSDNLPGADLHDLMLAIDEWFTDTPRDDADVRKNCVGSHSAVNMLTRWFNVGWADKKAELERRAASQDHISEVLEESMAAPRVSDPWATLWKVALSELRLQMTKATFDAWVSQTSVIGYEAGVLSVGVSSAQAADWLENRFKSTMLRTVQGILCGVPADSSVLPAASQVSDIKFQVSGSNGKLAQ